MTSILKNGSVFIHVPKTGGSYLSRTLHALGLAHLCMMAQPHANAYYFTGYRPFVRFAFVRHPWDWLMSYWAYKQATGCHPAVYLDQMVVKAEGDFNMWIRMLYANEGQPVNEFMSLFVGTMAAPIEFIGRYENLQEDFKAALRVAELLDCAGGVPESLVDQVWVDKPEPAYRESLMAMKSSRELVLRCEEQYLDRFYRGWPQLGFI